MIKSTSPAAGLGQGAVLFPRTYIHIPIATAAILVSSFLSFLSFLIVYGASYRSETGEIFLTFPPFLKKLSRAIKRVYFKLVV